MAQYEIATLAERQRRNRRPRAKFTVVIAVHTHAIVFITIQIQQCAVEVMAGQTFDPMFDLL